MGRLNEIQLAMLINLDDEDPGFDPDEYDDEIVFDT